MKIRKPKKVKAFKHKDVKKTFILECACGTPKHRLVIETRRKTHAFRLGI